MISSQTPFFTLILHSLNFVVSVMSPLRPLPHPFSFHLQVSVSQVTALVFIHIVAAPLSLGFSTQSACQVPSFPLSSPLLLEAHRKDVSDSSQGGPSYGQKWECVSCSVVIAFPPQHGSVEENGLPLFNSLHHNCYFLDRYPRHIELLKC